MSSSLFDGLHSDNVYSDLPQTADRSRHSRAPSSRPRSSSRPRGPPSESAGAPSEAGGFLDDGGLSTEAASRRRGAAQRDDVERVVDPIGEGMVNTFAQFLDRYVEQPDSSAMPISSVASAMTDRFYVAQIHSMRAQGLSTLYVDFRHLEAFEAHTPNRGVLARAIRDQYWRMLPYMLRALNEMIQTYEPQYYREHRQPGSTTTGSDTTSNGANATSQATAPSDKTVNQQTDKLFTLGFYNLPVVSRIRQLRTDEIGNLSSISGTVTRTSEVRPELHSGTFICEHCSTTVYNLEQIFRYTEPSQCPNVTCGNRESWRLDIKQSVFVDWQKIRVQENSSEIPTGSMPRTMDVIVRGEMVDRAKAGEKCIFTGTLIVVPDISQFRLPSQNNGPPQVIRNVRSERGGAADAGGNGVSGLKALGVRDLTYRLAFLSCMITPDRSSRGQNATQALEGRADNLLASLGQGPGVDPFAGEEEAQQEYINGLTAAEIADLKDMVHMPNIYARLVDSLAPMVYGHEVVKKGLLLQLMGGVQKMTPEGMALRGDINVCIVGDPSTSKSQFLKYICSFLPRAVYTSGKASSAAGLTAAVVKDEETGDFTIEAGALMLADNGICAIDEFDKMDIADQVAIHEAMEQQTISIAKAGIQATLNARTSILAAANPVGGRYNRKATLRANINMSAPIMSRFDLFFVILDECNESVDRHLASHIVNIHRLRDDAVQPQFSTERLQRYIRFARTFKPEFTDEAKATLVEKYKELRADDAQGGVGRSSYRITVRQLESMIRLSEAIAKANCVHDVTTEFVNEAFKLLRQSIISVEKDDIEVDDDDMEEASMADIDAAIMAGALDGDLDADGGNAAPTAPMMGDGAAQEPARRPRTTITFDTFNKMRNLLVRRVNSDEQETGEGVEENDLVVWYLEQKEDEMQTPEDMARESELCRKVLKRMVKDSTLMLIRGEGLRESAAPDGEAEENVDDRVVYVIHPNYSIEDNQGV